MLLALAIAFLDVSCGMLDSATMQGLLDLHNEFRQKAATEGNGISNMKQMVSPFEGRKLYVVLEIRLTLSCIRFLL